MVECVAAEVGLSRRHAFFEAFERRSVLPRLFRELHAVFWLVISKLAEFLVAQWRDPNSLASFRSVAHALNT